MKIETPLFELADTYRKALEDLTHPDLEIDPQVVSDTDEDVIPEEFFDMKPVLSKVRVREWIKANGPMDGAEIIRKTSVRIK